MKGGIRVGISNRLRYEVLRRDDYTCRYCGAKPPEVKITVDHVVPVALGGSDDPTNLAAACAACNGGKTSSSPDAPVVTEVSDDAIRWSRAMSEAAGRMQADHAAQQAVYDQFEDWWAGWNYGFRKVPLPRPNDWRSSVDGFLAAGLPLDVLKWCIDKAGASKAAPDATWRYMCGIAWKKVTELQESAKTIAGSPPNAPGDTASAAVSLMDGRASLARELLAEVSDEERAYFLECADVNEFLDEDEQRTKEEEACEAVSYGLNSARCNLDWLVSKIKETMERLPPEIGEGCLAELRTTVTLEDPLARMAHEAWGALLALEDLINTPAATAWAGKLSEAELAEWFGYAHELHPNAELSDERWLIRAWRCAEVIAANRYYPAMCGGSGEHIPNCPTPGTHRAFIAELKCCGPERAEDHKGHLVCEQHLEQLMAGTFTNRSGQLLNAVDFTEVAASENDLAPF